MVAMQGQYTLTVPAPGGDFEEFRVPDGGEVYRLVVTDILETRPTVYQGKVKEGKFDVRLQIAVADDESEFDGVWWKQWFGFSLHEKARLRKLINAIRRDDELDVSEQIDLADYLHKPFRGLVEVDEVPAREDPSRILRFAKVTTFMAIKAKKAAAKPAARPAAPAVEDGASEDEDEEIGDGTDKNNPFE